MIQRLKNQDGISLIETIVTMLIMAFALVSIYIGILYAEKQMQRNYHDRVATLAASGELDWQFYYLSVHKEFDMFSGRAVVLDNLARGRTLNGVMSIQRRDTYETPFGTTVPYTPIEAKVTWIEPGDDTQRSIVVREDFYKVNN